MLLMQLTHMRTDAVSAINCFVKMTSIQNSDPALYARGLFLNAVKFALSAAGYEEKEYNSQIQAALKITYSAAYRKLSQEVGWSDSDIAAIAAYLKQPVEKIMGAAAGIPCRSETISAQIVIDGILYKCVAEVGQPLKDNDYSEFVLIENDSQVKQVVRFDDGFDITKSFRVESIKIFPSQRRLPTVAILEDNVDALESACEILKNRRFSPIPFNSIEALRAEIEHKKFDIIVLDWWVNGESAEQLVKEIRNSSANKNCDLAIVTGELFAGGKANEESLERIIAQHKVKTHIKPVRWSLLAAEWSN